MNLNWITFGLTISLVSFANSDCEAIAQKEYEKVKNACILNEPISHEPVTTVCGSQYLEGTEPIDYGNGWCAKLGVYATNCKNVTASGSTIKTWKEVVKQEIAGTKKACVGNTTITCSCDTISEPSGEGFFFSCGNIDLVRTAKQSNGSSTADTINRYYYGKDPKSSNGECTHGSSAGKAMDACNKLKSSSSSCR